MTDKARDLLERALNVWDVVEYGCQEDAIMGLDLQEEIRAYLAEPVGEIREKHHGIGGGE